MNYEDFRSQLRDLTDGEDLQHCADALCISLPTLERWIAGESAPFPTGRKPTIVTLEKLKLDKQQRM